jgi:hypothetical protein
LARDNDLDAGADEFGSEQREPFGFSVGESRLDDEILSFHVTELRHAFDKGRVAAALDRRFPRGKIEEADPR